MDFSLTDEQSDLKDAVAKFAAEELNSGLARRDREHTFNREGWNRCAQQGVQGLPIPAQYGGRGADPVSVAAALEGLGYGCRDNGLWFAVNAHMWGCAAPLLAFGSEEQKSRYLPSLCNGEWIGALAMSEPDSGSDAYSLKMTAQRRGDEYILTGRKIFISNGPVSDLTLVLANVDLNSGPRGITAFLLEKDMAGAVMSGPVDKMGLHTVLMGELDLKECVVPAANRLGKEGAGVAVFNHAMEWERGFILAGAVGAMERLLEQCCRYARERKQFGQPIGAFQHVSGKLADMKVRLEAARMMLYKVAWLKSRRRSAVLEAGMAKLYISEAWAQACQDALQIHGGYGYLAEAEIERELRDALAGRIYSGTSEVQRLLIATWMGLA